MRLRVLVLAAAVLGCSDREERPAPPPAAPAPPPAARGLDQLRFQPKELGDRLRALEACVRGARTDWRHLPYQEIGNFFTARWCAGRGSRDDCQWAAGSAEMRDQHVVELHTLTHRLPDVFGLGLLAARVPATTGWGAQLTFVEGGRTIEGESLHLDFSRYDAPAGAPALAVHLGSSLAYKVHETEIQAASGAAPREDLERLTGSPEALRDRGLAHLDQLAASVEAAIQGGTPRICQPGPYKGGGVPPECNPRPLTADEGKAALAAARAHIRDQKAALTASYREMYAALLAAFPLDRCRP
jgi:hypothetical protein